MENKKTILLGITASIAIGKTIDLIEILKEKFTVEVILTERAENLIDISQVSDLCKVHTKMFDENMKWHDYLNRVEHISLSDKADLMLIAPATANVIAKLAHGIADDLLTTTVLAVDQHKIPVVIAPAMNCKMYENSITQENIQKLKKKGVIFIGPEYGSLACGYEGMGRLCEPKEIYEEVNKILLSKRKEKKLINRTVLITSGPTFEEIDPVRIITNKSSGKMGNALCKTALELGANVIHIQGPMKTKEMFEKVKKHFPNADIFINCAAICDFIPLYHNHKIKKDSVSSSDDIITLQFKKNIDVLQETARLKLPHQKVVGFALETENLIENASKKLHEKYCDLIVGNDISTAGSDEIKSVFIDKQSIELLPKVTKEELAERIFDKII